MEIFKILLLPSETVLLIYSLMNQGQLLTSFLLRSTCQAFAVLPDCYFHALANQVEGRGSACPRKDGIVLFWTVSVSASPNKGYHAMQTFRMLTFQNAQSIKKLESLIISAFFSSSSWFYKSLLWLACVSLNKACGLFQVPCEVKLLEL